MSGDDHGMGELDLDAIEARALNASPAPWHYGGVASVGGGNLYDATRTIADLIYEQPDDHDGRIVRHILSAEADRNGSFISHAREDVPALVAEVRRLHARLVHVSDDRDYWRQLAERHSGEQGR